MGNRTSNSYKVIIVNKETGEEVLVGESIVADVEANIENER